MKHLLTVGTLLLALPGAALSADDRHDVSAAAYEHLATAIIEIRATEDRLVEGILYHHYGTAMQHLRTAMEEGKVGDHARAAADEINAIANEGGKRVQAVRQKLLQAGHHHHTDAETEDDYIWIDSSERQKLIDLGGHVARITDTSSLQSRMDELTELFTAAMKPE